MTNARKSREATAEKAAKMRAEAAAKERRRRISIIAGATVVVLAIAGGVTAFVLSQNKSSSTAGASLAAVKTYKVASRNHVQGTVKYAQNPPVGGDHNPVWLNCGIYTSPVKNENAVHDMEHGAVWVTYQPTLAKSDIAKLTSQVRGQTYIDLTPYPGLPAPVVASAWGVQIQLTGANDPRLGAFIKKYKQGPQTPEPGAACTGGTGTPDE
jgi:Protein of unknown function (DUF3105)